MGLARIDTLWIRYISEVLHVNSPNGSRPRRWSVKSSSTSAVSRWHRRLHPIPAKAELEASATRGVGRPRAERPRTVSEAAEELGLSVYTVRAGEVLEIPRDQPLVPLRLPEATLVG